METIEGVLAYKDAIAALEQKRPMKPLKWSASCAVACLDHVQEIGEGGIILTKKNENQDLLTIEQKVEQFAQLGDPWAESLIYEAKSPIEALEKLIVCDGQKSRANRNAIFNKELYECAIAGYDHPTKGSVIQVIYVNKLYFKPEFNLETRKLGSLSDKISDGLDVVLRRSSLGIMSNYGGDNANVNHQDKTDLINRLNRSIKANA